MLPAMRQGRQGGVCPRHYENRQIKQSQLAIEVAKYRRAILSQFHEAIQEQARFPQACFEQDFSQGVSCLACIGW